jgi:hypothetical protein
MNVIDDAWRGADKTGPKLALEALLDNLHVKKPEETATEPEAEGLA